MSLERSSTATHVTWLLADPDADANREDWQLLFPNVAFSSCSRVELLTDSIGSLLTRTVPLPLLGSIEGESVVDTLALNLQQH